MTPMPPTVVVFCREALDVSMTLGRNAPYAARFCHPAFVTAPRACTTAGCTSSARRTASGSVTSSCCAARGSGLAAARPAPASSPIIHRQPAVMASSRRLDGRLRSEEHTSELQSPYELVCRLLLEKKKKKTNYQNTKKKIKKKITKQK